MSSKRTTGCVCFFAVCKRTNNAFDTGEELTYRVYYSSAIIDATAGEAVLKVTDWTGFKTPEKDTAYHIIATGNSKGLFNFFYKVRDKYESYINKETLLSHVFVRNTSEGDYKQFDRVTFNHTKHVAYTSRKNISRLYSICIRTILCEDRASTRQLNRSPRASPGCLCTHWGSRSTRPKMTLSTCWWDVTCPGNM